MPQLSVLLADWPSLNTFRCDSQTLSKWACTDRHPPFICYYLAAWVLCFLGAQVSPRFRLDKFTFLDLFLSPVSLRLNAPPPVSASYSNLPVSCLVNFSFHHSSCQVSRSTDEDVRPVDLRNRFWQPIPSSSDAGLRRQLLRRKAQWSVVSRRQNRLCVAATIYLDQIAKNTAYLLVFLSRGSFTSVAIKLAAKLRTFFSDHSSSTAPILYLLTCWIATDETLHSQTWPRNKP